MGLFEKVQEGFKSISDRLGVDVPDKDGYDTLVTDPQTMKTLRDADNSCSELEKQVEWPVATRNRKAAKPDTGAYNKTISSENEKNKIAKNIHDRDER